MNVIAPFKTVRIKNNASEWFDGKIAEKIFTQDKLHADEEIYKKTSNTGQNLIRRKRKACFEEN